jgi:hypothetical protein
VTVYRLGCCGEVWGGLLIFDHAGGEIARIAAPDGFFGVFDAHGVGGV